MKIHWLALIGTLLGGGLASWLGPSVIVWYSTPPVEYGVSCKGPIEWALYNLQLTVLIGMVLGCVLGLIAYFLFRKKKGTDLETI